MNPDLRKIYEDVKEYADLYGLLENKVNIRVEDNIFIKIYIDEENGINGQFKKPLMNIYFSAPGVLTVKALLPRNVAESFAVRYKLIGLEKGSYRIDFDNVKDFEEFIGSI